MWCISNSEWPETRCFIVIAFQLCFGICHQEGTRKLESTKIDRTDQLLVCADDVTRRIQNVRAVYYLIYSAKGIQEKIHNLYYYHHHHHHHHHSPRFSTHLLLWSMSFQMLSVKNFCCTQSCMPAVLDVPAGL